MYIEPNSTVKLLKSVPLDTSYRNTVVWDNLTAQVNGFSAFTKHTLSKQSYQRINKGVFRCEKSADACYDCNYMMFQNTAYGNKWFYAFINKVEYINDSMCQIVFTLDIIQTWYNEWSFESCFVERETVSSDKLFEHTVQENFEGDTISFKTIRNIISNKLHNVDKVSFLHIACVSEAYIGSGNITAGNLPDDALTNVENWSTFKPQTIGNVFNAMGYYVFEDTSTGLQQASYLIHNYNKASKKDSIKMIYTIPDYCLTGIQWTSGNYISTDFNNPTGTIIDISSFLPTVFEAENSETTYGSYVPKNKKMFTYPFCFLELSNKNGSSQILRLENLSGIGETFTAYLVATFGYMPNTSILCRPSYYSGQLSNDKLGVSIDGIQIGNYTSDTFIDWWSRERSSYIAKSAKTLLNFGMGVSQSRGTNEILRNEISTSKTMGNDALDLLSEGKQMAITSDSVLGNLSTFNQLYANKDFDFTLTAQVLRPEIAKTIDNYFTMYGYRVNVLKVPTVRNRPHWTYIKTRGCNIKGSMPADDVATIEDIVDNGITFWRNINEVGDYSLDNSI
jgi:hypothetical protein|nr:MAG TPA_asm: Major tail protein [Caudoviricetes sp.]